MSIANSPSVSPPETAREIFARVDSFVRRIAEAQSGRTFLWFVAFFAAGIVAFFSWRDDPLWWPAPMLAVGAGVVAWMMRRHLLLRVTAILIAAFAFGHVAAQIRTTMVAAPILEREMGPFVLSARVTDVEKRPDGNHVIVDEFVLPGVAGQRAQEKLRLTLPSTHGLPGVDERISVRVMLRPPALPVVPGGYQFQRALYFGGIGATGFAVGRWQLEPSAASLSWRARAHAWTEALRRKIGDRITQAIPNEHGAVAAALINGEQSAIPDDLQEVYRVAGIAHLLSISGVHMSLLAAIVFLIVRRGTALWPWLALRADTKKIAAWIALAATAFYLVISGVSVPAVRSFIMVAIVFAAILLDRTALSVRSIAWAALVLMALLPDAIVGASFQMSFLAVLSLICLYEQTRLKIEWRTRDGEFRILHAAMIYVAGVLLTDIVAGGATSLFAVYHFNRIPTYSFVANAVAVPLTGVWIMPFGVLALVLMPFGLDEWPLILMGKGVELLDVIAAYVATLPNAQVHVPPMNVELLAAGAAGAVFVCLWRGNGRWIGLAPVIAAFAVPWITPAPDLLVDDSARVFAVTDEHGRIVSRPSRAGSFVKEVWSDRFGASTAQWPGKGVAAEDLNLGCDGSGCVLTRHGQKALIAFSPEAVAEDCGDVNAIIADSPSHFLCRQGKMIDRFDLRRNGGYELWLSPNGIRTRSVRDVVGTRVWTGFVAAPQRDSRPENDRRLDEPYPLLL